MSTSYIKAHQAIERGMARTAILAGGFGQRLDTIADPDRNKWAIAKPACPVGNLRMIEFNMRALRRANLTDFHLMLCHLPHTIRQVVGDGKIYGSNVTIHESREVITDPLDTASVVGKLVHHNDWARNPNDVIIVPSADIIHNIDIAAALDTHLYNREKHGAVATIVVNRVPWGSVERFGTVRLEGMPERTNFNSEPEFEDAVGAWLTDNAAASAKIQEFKEKMARSAALSNLNNSSLYIFNASLFNVLIPMFTKDKKGLPLIPESHQSGGPSPFSDWGSHIFKWLTEKAQSDNYPVFAYIMPQSGYWRDAGLGEELRQANMDVLDGVIDSGLKEAEGSLWFRTGNESWHGKNVFIHPNAHVRNSLIGDNVSISENTRIVHSVVGANTHVESGVQMYGTVVFPKPRDMQEFNVIGKDSQINDCLILGGKLGPGSNFRGVALCEPVGGMAIGSLGGKTQYFSPK